MTLSLQKRLRLRPNLDLGTDLGGVSASSFSDGVLAPPGYHWDFVIDDYTGERDIDDYTGQPVVDLVAN